MESHTCRLRDARHVQGPQDRRLARPFLALPVVPTVLRRPDKAAARLWMRLPCPHLTFIMPHWLYWAGLLLFPLIAIYLVRRQMRHRAKRRGRRFSSHTCSGSARDSSASTASICAARSASSSFPYSSSILYCNSAGARSEGRHVAHVRGTRAGAEHRATDASPTRQRRRRRRLPHTRACEADVRQRQSEYAVAKAVTDHWFSMGRWGAIVLAILLLIDAVLMPGLVRKRRAYEADASRAGSRRAAGDRRRRASRC